MIKRCTPTNFFSASVVVIALLLLILTGCTAPNYQHTPYLSNGSKAKVSNSHTLVYRLILVGDLGSTNIKYNQEKTLNAIKELSKTDNDKTTVIFLGDNIYDNGMPDNIHSEYNNAIKNIAPQHEILGNANRSGPSGIFVMGNHDWDNSGKSGQEKAINQYRYFKNLKNVDGLLVTMPVGGCPGPLITDLPQAKDLNKKGFRIIAIDSQWWLQETKFSNHCFESDDDISTYKTKFLAQFEKALSTSEDRAVIVVAHHPLDTHGPHGGYSSGVPVFGAIISWIRFNSPEWLAKILNLDKNQDLSGKANKDMLIHFKTVLQKYKPMVFASGHEHTLQVIHGGDTAGHLLVSGSGAKSSPVTAAVDSKSVASETDSVFAYGRSGFMTLDFIENSASETKVLLRVYQTDTKTNVVYSHWMH